MVIHHRSLFLPVSAEFCDATQPKSCSHLPSTLQTKVGVVHRTRLPLGEMARETVTYSFDAEMPVQGDCLNPPYVDVEGVFFLPSVSQPEVFDTLVRVDDHTFFLVSAYFDIRLGRNPNLKRDFPNVPWCGEIAVLFV